MTREWRYKATWDVYMRLMKCKIDNLIKCYIQNWILINTIRCNTKYILAYIQNYKQKISTFVYLQLSKTKTTNNVPDFIYKAQFLKKNRKP